MKVLLIPIISSLVFLSGCAYAPTSNANNVRVLGSTYLTKAENDRDVLYFRPCRRDVNAIKLQVSRGQVEIEKIWVRFANGQSEVLHVRDRIPARGESRWIDLPGGERCITSIGVVGDTEYSRDQARVKILAR